MPIGRNSIAALDTRVAPPAGLSPSALRVTQLSGRCVTTALQARQPPTTHPISTRFASAHQQPHPSTRQHSQRQHPPPTTPLAPTMSRQLNKQQKDKLVQFVGITGAEQRTALECLQLGSWSVEAAIDYFYTSGLAAAAQRHSGPRLDRWACSGWRSASSACCATLRGFPSLWVPNAHTAPVCLRRDAIHRLYLRYKDPDNEQILAEGIAKLCEDLGARHAPTLQQRMLLPTHAAFRAVRHGLLQCRSISGAQHFVTRPVWLLVLLRLLCRRGAGRHCDAGPQLALGGGCDVRV